MTQRNRILRSKGKFFWKYEWYSFCGIHGDYNELCKMCTAGSWVNVWIRNIGSIIYKFFPNLWRWWMNTNFIKKKHTINNNFNKLK